jgi:uncharacterized protein with von Willebrand factor type A (vWA) domain
VRQRILGFIDLLRREGLSPGPGETLDALAAVAAAGVERGVLRECLATTLVKNHAERPAFDAIFDRYFALPDRPRRQRSRSHASGAEQGAGASRGPGGGGPPSPGAARREADGGNRRTEPGSDADPSRKTAGRRDLEETQTGEERKAEVGEAERGRRKAAGPREGDEAERSGHLLAKQRALMARPFREMDAREVEEVRDLARDLAPRFRRRYARRTRAGKPGRLDIRRTLRRALSRGGVPIELFHRRPRPAKADLLALVDLSFSTATAAEFLLAVLAPARSYFRSVNLFAYVDQPVEISFERGHVVPHGRLDLGARSDFGNVLAQLALDHEHRIARNTVLLVLGDARNNRRPPRADLLARLRRKARALVWLNPEPPERWNTGDSVMSAYARHADIVLAASHPAALIMALARVVAVAIR